jgi:ABC-2 type transport system permease protein
MNGAMVMRGVMEEKTSRISEVMISSVKPFELMMGKIVGVGLVGMTQLVVTGALFVGIGSLFPLLMHKPSVAPNAAMTGMPNMDASAIQSQTNMLWEELGRQNWVAIIPLFLMYFILGYFMYASLFAAVGSAVGDDQGEAQTLTLPLMLPVILAVYIAMAAIRAPESSLAVWSSIFPLFSPIVMPTRLAYHPPFWQVALSLSVLIATVLTFVWFAGRIYRVGILMYGKKASFKELGKWLFYKD